MKRKDLNYKLARDTIYSKDKSLEIVLDSMLTQASEMFTYENLPSSLPKRVLERMLLEGGYCIFTKHNDKYIALQGGLGGMLNEYYEYTQCIVSNPYLKLEKTYTFDKDCVLIRNDSRMIGIVPSLSKWAVQYIDNEMTINMVQNIMRAQFMLSAGDDKTKESANEFIRKLMNGEFICVAENKFLDGLSVRNTQMQQGYITQFIELMQYIKSGLYGVIGLETNYNMKRERLTSAEAELNTPTLIPFVDNMLEERTIACKKINDMYGLDLHVKLASAWETQRNRAEDDAYEAIIEAATETDTPIETSTETGAPVETTETEEEKKNAIE